MFTTVIMVTVLAYLAQSLITPASTQNIYLCPRPTPSSHIRALRRSLLSVHTSPTSSRSHLLAAFHFTKNAPPDKIKTERFFWKKVP